MQKEPSNSEEVEELANLISKKITWTTNMVMRLAYDITQAGYSRHPKKKELRELDVDLMVRFLDDYYIKSLLCFDMGQHECMDLASEICSIFGSPAMKYLKWPEKKK